MHLQENKRKTDVNSGIYAPISSSRNNMTTTTKKYKIADNSGVSTTSLSARMSKTITTKKVNFTAKRHQHIEQLVTKIQERHKE